MIKAIIFDIGGVILEAENLALPVNKVFQPEDIDAFWQELNEKFSPLCRGEGSLLQFWKDLAKDNNKSIPESTLKRLWVEEFDGNLVINKDVRELIINLKKNDYKLAIISNAIKEHADILRKNDSFLKLFKMFDVVILSNEVKMAKDSKEIFLLTLEKLRLEPQECVFTDDTKKFVENARALGIHAFQFKNIKQFKKDLEMLKVRF